MENDKERIEDESMDEGEEEDVPNLDGASAGQLGRQLGQLVGALGSSESEGEPIGGETISTLLGSIPEPSTDMFELTEQEMKAEEEKAKKSKSGGIRDLRDRLSGTGLFDMGDKLRKSIGRMVRGGKSSRKLKLTAADLQYNADVLDDTEESSDGLDLERGNTDSDGEERDEPEIEPVKKSKSRRRTGKKKKSMKKREPKEAQPVRRPLIRLRSMPENNMKDPLEVKRSMADDSAIDPDDNDSNDEEEAPGKFVLDTLQRNFRFRNKFGEIDIQVAKARFCSGFSLQSLWLYEIVSLFLIIALFWAIVQYFQEFEDTFQSDFIDGENTTQLDVSAYRRDFNDSDYRSLTVVATLAMVSAFLFLIFRLTANCLFIKRQTYGTLTMMCLSIDVCAFCIIARRVISLSVSEESAILCSDFQIMDYVLAGIIIFDLCFSFLNSFLLSRGERGEGASVLSLQAAIHYVATVWVAIPSILLSVISDLFDNAFVVAGVPLLVGLMSLVFMILALFEYQEGQQEFEDRMLRQDQLNEERFGASGSSKARWNRTHGPQIGMTETQKTIMRLKERDKVHQDDASISFFYCSCILPLGWLIGESFLWQEIRDVKFLCNLDSILYYWTVTAVLPLLWLSFWILRKSLLPCCYKKAKDRNREFRERISSAGSKHSGGTRTLRRKKDRANTVRLGSRSDRNRRDIESMLPKHTVKKTLTKHHMNF